MRILFDALLVCAVLFSPWWLFALLALSGMIYFKKFYEAPAAALLFDALFSFPIQFTENFSFQYFFFAFSLALYTLVAFMKTKVR